MILHITVTVDSDRLDQIAEQLAVAGMSISAKLSVLGMLTGSIPAELKETIEQLDGVHQVYVSRKIEVE